MKTLIIAEKSSVCKKIKNALEVEAKWSNGYYEGDKYIFAYCVGHLLRLKYPEEIDSKLKKWSFDSIPFAFDNIPLTVNDSVKEQFYVVKKLIERNDIKEIVNLCDPDREGELIFRNMYEYTKPDTNIKVSRMWLTTTESNEALIKCFNERIEQVHYDNLYNCAKARSYADYFIGLSNTRAVSLKYGLGKVLTVGRVQTPTLKLIVDRYKENQNFKEETYYKLEAETSEGITGTYFNENLDDNRFKSIKEAEQIKEKIGTGLATITKFEQKKTYTKPKPLFNLSDLQIKMNKEHKMNADDTLKACQSLYENHGVITYPRTSENRVSEEVAKDYKDYLKAVPFKRAVETIEKYGFTLSNDVVAKKEIGSHEALTPTKKEVNQKLFDTFTKDEKRCYEAICIRFLENFFPPSEYLETKIEFEKEGETFKFSDKTLTKLGFLYVLGETKIKDEKKYYFKEGEHLNISKINIVNGKTTPPALFSEGDLLKAMKNISKYVEDKKDKEILKETDGLGTEATRSVIIEVLKKQEYIKVSKNKLVPTEKGVSLIDALDAKDIVSVALTAISERYLEEIKAGKKGPKEYLDYIKNINFKMIEEIKTGENKLVNQNTADTICSCPNCGGNIIESRYGYYCKNKCGVSISYEQFKGLGIKKVSVTLCKSLLTKGKSGKLNMISKNGRPYQAYIKYEFDNDRNVTSLEFVDSKVDKK